jgi:hypothetical protein
MNQGKNKGKNALNVGIRGFGGLGHKTWYCAFWESVSDLGLDSYSPRKNR